MYGCEHKEKKARGTEPDLLHPNNSISLQKIERKEQNKKDNVDV